jgi:hypothetical protein
MDHAETVAQAVVEALETGSRMQHQARQSHGEHDFNLLCGDGRIAALEVTAAADEQAEQTVDALLGKRKGGPFVPTKLCKQDWYIHPGRNACINKIRAKADEYLAQVEAEGLNGFFSPLDAAGHHSVCRIWNDLGIVGGWVTRRKMPGQIGILPPGDGGTVAVADFTEAVCAEAEKPDNRRKLGASKADERHLFVYIHPGNYLPWVAFVDSEPPSEPVALPTEVTHVWAAAEGRSLNEFVVWRARRGEPWRNCGPLTLVLIAPPASGKRR